MRGKRFGCQYVDEWERIDNIRTTPYIDTTVDKIPEPVFVTAFDEVYRTRAERLVIKLRESGFNEMLIVYAMSHVTEDGLKSFRKACNVEVRIFNFKKYPEYMKKLKEYRFKPLVVAEVLAEYQSVWWLDASISFKNNNVSHIYDMVDCRKTSKSLRRCNSPFLLHFNAGHGTFPVTHKDIYGYIPTHIEEIKKISQYAATMAYVVRTEQVMQGIMKWWVLCALEEGCMAPKGSLLDCVFGKNRLLDNALCNRFDQSIINLLLVNIYNYDPSYFQTDTYGTYFTVERSFPERIDESKMQCRNN